MKFCKHLFTIFVVVCFLTQVTPSLAQDKGPDPGPDSARQTKKPHIVYILADDLGWKDVGWHGSEIQTAHLDNLAKKGARLEQFYVMPVCTPTRSALMTGRHPIRFGLQTGVIRPWENRSLPLEERTLAQALQSAGYFTAILGKWHLGQSDPAFLPTRRGFNYQYGHYTGAIDYWTHQRFGGLDWHRNDRGLVEEGYTTQLLAREAVQLLEKHPADKPLFLYLPFNAPHSPLQAPKEYLDRYKGIKDEKRRTYAAMVHCLSDAVGAVVSALSKRGMLENTLIIFHSDNGGPTNLGANNGSLRAGKGTLYEGGIRVPAFAYFPSRFGPRVIHRPMHVVDWYPTILRLAGASSDQKLPVDGRDMWAVLAGGAANDRVDREMLLNAEQNRGAIRVGDWKLVFTGRLPAEVGKADKIGLEGAELFDLGSDANEQVNRATKEPAQVRALLTRLNHYARIATPATGGGGGNPPKGWKAPAVYGEKAK